jgi:hypothetical protein
VRQVLARLLLEDLKQPDLALDHIRDSLAATPDDLTSNLLYAQALEQKGEVEAAVTGFRKLLDLDNCCLEAYRGLGRLMKVLGSPAVVISAISVLDLLDAATVAELEQLEGLRHKGGPHGRLEVSTLPIEADLRPLARYLDHCLPHLGPVFGLEPEQPLKPTHPAAVAATELAHSLGLSGIRLEVGGTAPAAAWVGTPPTVKIAPHLANDPESAAFRFWVGRALSSASTAGALLERLSNQKLDQLFLALTTHHTVGFSVQQLRKQVLRALPRKVRKQIDQLKAPKTSAELWTRYRDFESERADQIGLLISGDPKTALGELAGAEGAGISPPQSHRVRSLMIFSVSDEYADYHKKLWTGGGAV